MNALPLIGLTPDLDMRGDDDAEAVYVLRKNYADAIRASGGMPIILPYDLGLVSSYVHLLDGLVVTGGMFDIDPRRYGAEPSTPPNTKEDRTTFEEALIRSALSEGLPLLGICNGMQLLAVTLGGSLVQDVGREVPTAEEHMPHRPATLPHHAIDFVSGSALSKLAGVGRTHVNSVHHQSVREASGYVVAARATDGVVEAIEVPGRAFCFGVQWHPEYHSSPIDRAIMAAFTAAADARMGTARSTSGRV